ncbi:MAG: hypothetical protein R3E46_18920 [Sedimenticolaceae bacterium]
MKIQTSTFGDQTIRGERATDWWTKLLLHPLFVPGVLLAGLAIRLLVAAVIPPEPMSDSAWYIARAKEMAAALQEAKADVDAGRYTTENVAEHMQRVADEL